MVEMPCSLRKLNFAWLKLRSVKIFICKERVAMKSKRIFQVLVVLVMLFSPVGSIQQARADTSSAPQLDPVVIPRSLSYWDATYIGFVSSGIYEKWGFEFTESHNFVVTVTPVAGDLIPLLILLDAGGTEITRGTGSLTSTQSAGTYSIQVQPQSGSGFYIMTLREVIQVQPAVSTVVNPSSVNAGESAVVTVSLHNVPAEGYTSAEFTCTYNASLVEASNIVVASLFGADPAVAINGPHPAGGSFIVAIAGSNGNKATTSGVAFTFSARGLEAGQTVIECTARVSKGDNALTQIPSTASSLTVVGSVSTPTFTPTPAESLTPTSTSTPVESPTPTSTSTPLESPTPTFTSTPIESPTATFTSTPVESPTPTSTSTPIESPTPTFTATPVESSTPTSTPLPTDGTLTGQVLASKPVTVSLYDATDTLITSVAANADGTFSLTAPAGTYTVVATASGFLNSEGPATLTGGNTSTMPTISLPAGDIDGNNVIDQFDALTIGMSYNTASPAAADLNNDGIINVLDLELLAGNYRETGPLAWQ